MSKPELVLSNTTSFFLGGMPALFRNAKKYGFKYVEIIPYRWTTPKQILDLAKKYDIQIAGIHMPTWWNQSMGQELRRREGILEKFFALIFNFYLSGAEKNPWRQIMRALAPQNPYLLIHTNVVYEMEGEFDETAKTFHVAIENIPFSSHRQLEFYWNPVKINQEMNARGLTTSNLVFDVGHFDQTRKKLPSLDLLEIYRQISPEVIHISYNSRGIHLLPNKKEQEELKTLLQIHAPKYIVIETNPLVSIQKAKKLLEGIIEKSTPSQSPPYQGGEKVGV